MEKGETIALGVSDEASPNMEGSTFRSGQSTESFPSNNNVMGRHHHHHLLLTTKNGGGGGGDDDDGGGPTQNDRGANPTESSGSPRTGNSSPIFRDDVVAASSAVPTFTGGRSGSAVAARTLECLDICPSLTTFKSPGEGMAAAPRGFPFTATQWKELEKQATIYKYMMAAVPVPPDLLLPTTNRNFSADPTFSLSNGSVYNLRCANRDLEPGRCKRTDGKKWRCSRDVAPHQKYCERHMHRGRPRSRKPVEVHPSVDTSTNKKTRLHYTALQTNPTAVPNPTDQANKCNFPPLFLGTSTTGQPKDPLVLGGACYPDISSKSCYKEPKRVPNWMMHGEMTGTNGVDQQWLHLMDAKRGFASKEGSIYGGNGSILQGGYEEEPLKLFSYPDFVPEDLQNSAEDCNMFLNSDLISLKQPQMQEYPVSRGFFDAWSNGNLKTINDDSVSKPRGNLSPSSLNLSIAMAEDERMGLGDLCHSVADSNHLEPKNCPVSWLPFTSGGPLAEVLQPRPCSITGGSNPASPYTANGDSVSPSVTAGSSPSGVLHKALFSHSDSSVCNSPTIAPSSAPPEVVAFQWLI